MSETNDNYKFLVEKDSGDGFKANFSKNRALGMKDQLSWMSKQMQYITFTEKYKTRFDCKKGEIYEVDWGVNVNAEFSYIHYGVVLVDSSPFNPLVIMCPLRENRQGAHPRNEFDLGYMPEIGKYLPVSAVISQIRSIDKLRLVSNNPIGEQATGVGENGLLIDDGLKIEVNPKLGNSIPRLKEEKLKLLISAYIGSLVN